MNTSKGIVSVKKVGLEGGTTFLALSGMGQRGCGVDWENTGIISHLVQSSKTNFRALLPDPYSNVDTSPSLGEFAVVRSLTTFFGLWSGPCRESWLLDLLPQPEAGKIVVLAGHSWGGGAVARLAAAHPGAVSRLVLISPDVQHIVAQQTFGTPTLLIWAKDDRVRMPIFHVKYICIFFLQIIFVSDQPYLLDASLARSS